MCARAACFNCRALRDFVSPFRNNMHTHTNTRQYAYANTESHRIAATLPKVIQAEIRCRRRGRRRKQLACASLNMFVAMHRRSHGQTRFQGNSVRVGMSVCVFFADKKVSHSFVLAF